MMCLIPYVVLAFALLHCALGRGINTTIYNADLEHGFYTHTEDFCARWSTSVFWDTCDLWIKQWKTQTYYNQGKRASIRQSLDHRFPLTIIKFQGSAIYLYGPPRAKAGTIPHGHRLEICLYENRRHSRKPICNHVDVTEAYSTASDWNSPVPIFSQRGLRDYEYQVAISLASAPLDTAESYLGLQFSHAVYTIEQSTPRLVQEECRGSGEVILNDNHPTLSYWPDKPICYDIFCWSSAGWESKTYTATDKTVFSWRELTAGNEPDQDQWGVDARITGGVAALYGAPEVGVGSTEHLGHICVRIDLGHCEIIDLQYAYLSAAHLEGPVLLWRNDGLDSSRKTRISVRLVKDVYGKTSVFPFKAIHYHDHEQFWHSSSLLPSVVALIVVVIMFIVFKRAYNATERSWRALPNAPQCVRPSPTPRVNLSRLPIRSERKVPNSPGNNHGRETITHIPEPTSFRPPPPPTPSPANENNPGPWPGLMQD